MPFTEKDVQTAIGQMAINLWSIQKQLEESQEENKQLKEKIDLLLHNPQPSEVISTE